jgi:hypothetical protein
MSSYYIFDIYLIVDLIQTIASIAVIIDAIEIVVERRQYSSSGIYNLEVLRTYKKWMMYRWIAPIYNILFDYPNYVFLVIIQLLVAILMISHLFTNLSLFFVIIILVVHILSHLRNRYGMNGSDQLQIIIFASLSTFYITSATNGDPILLKSSIFFLALQTIISYFMSGLAKLASPVWRNGTAIAGIMNTESFGNKVFAQILINNPLLSKLICYWVILFECVFPILIFMGVNTTMFVLLNGILFHLSTAILMRFNSFLWSFIATYPSLFFFAFEFQNFIGYFHLHH